MSLGPHTITRLRGVAAIDPYSSEQTGTDWTTPGQLTIAGCSVQPGAATPELRDQANREGVVIEYTAFAPLADVTERDRIRWNDIDYEIAEAMQRWEFPPLAHLVIPLKRVEG